MREKLDKKLDELEKQSLIEKCSGTSDWVSPLDCVPKPENDIRICVDMRLANKAVIRERQPIPTNDDVMHEFNKSTIFSKLDLKWGYHRIVFDNESRRITTFCAHQGLCMYTRLMFGVSCVPEMYQKVIQQLFSSCPGVNNILDNTWFNLAGT